MNQKIFWVIVVALISISLGAVVIELTSDSATIKFEGEIKAKIYDGMYKVYSGRNLVFTNRIIPYYMGDDSRYHQMYKARGNKYSDLMYYKGENYIWLRQDVYFSKGVLENIFRIDELGQIKQSFNFIKDEPMRMKFGIKYSDLDEDKPDKYLNSKRTILNIKAELDFGFILDWEEELKNTVSVNRYKNGNLWLNTRVFKENEEIHYDPELFINQEAKLKSDAKKTQIIDEYCIDIDTSWHKKRCNVQYERDDFFPCYVDGFEYYCPSLGQGDVKVMSQFLSTTDKEVLLTKGIETSTSVYLNPLEEQKGEVTKGGLTIGFETNEFEITDFIYGEEYNVSIDTDVEVTNLHAKNISAHVLVNNTAMIGYWQFETGAVDSSDEGNDGDITEAVETHEGRVGKAYSFDGIDDSINITEASDFDFGTGNFSIGLWVYWKDKNNAYMFTFKNGTAVTDFPLGCIMAGTGNAYSASVGEVVCYSTLTGSRKLNYVLTEENWTHLMFTRNGTGESQFKLYVNGALVNTTKWEIPINVDNLFIGMMAQNYNHFNGSIDEVSVWNVTLSASEVSDLYDKGNILGKNEYEEIVRYEFTDGPNEYYGRANGTVSGATHSHEKYSFDGNDDFIDFGNFSGFQFSEGDNFTISLWFYDIIVGESPILSKIHNETLGKGGYSLFVDSFTDNLKFYLGAGDTHVYVNATQTVSSEVWYHASVVIDNKNASLYINGELENSETFTYLNSSWNNLYVGGGFENSDGNNDTFWYGNIDELIIYNRSLSSTEVKRIWKDGLFHTVDYGDSYIDGGTLGTTRNVEWLGIQCAATNNSYTNATCRMKPLNFTALNTSDDGLVSYWNLSEAEDKLEFMDSYEGTYPNGNNVTCSGSGCPNRTAGVFEGDAGLKFDGIDDYIYSSTNVSADTWTFAAWIKFDQCEITDQIVEIGHTSYAKPQFKLNASCDLDSLFCPAPTYYVDGEEGRTGIDDNQWHHVVLTDCTVTVEDQVIIGAWGTNNAGYRFNGTIDSVAIWNRSLSAAEVSELYAQNVSGWSQYVMCDDTLRAVETYTSNYFDYQCKLESSNTTHTPVLTSFSVSYEEWTTVCVQYPCQIIWEMNGTTSANETRYYYIYWDTLNYDLSGGKSAMPQPVMDTDVNMTFITRVASSISEIFSEVWNVW